jgi:nicotinamidase-related amidase
MDHDRSLHLPFRRQRLVETKAGYMEWETTTDTHPVTAGHTALVLCDVWDRHWCRGANERLAVLLPHIDHVTGALRTAGALVVHAPSETMDFYAGTSARRRAIDAPYIEVPLPASHADPPLPIDAADEGCDTPPDTPHRAWTRQHPAISIDQQLDAISDNGEELYRLYRHRGITTILIMGVHTNMCILKRSFAIKALVRQGFDVALVRDLTDTMYNPARPPYVDHAEGTCLLISYVEKFWCATVSSAELLAALEPEEAMR